MKLFLVIILVSCTALAQDETAIAKAKSACGPDNIKFDVGTSNATHPPAIPEAGKALVFVVGQGITRPCAGCTMAARVGVDGAWAGAIRTDSYMSLTVEPGAHHLCTNWQSLFGSRSKLVALANITAEPGKIYYFRMRFFEGNEAYLDLDLTNQDEGRYLVASSHVSVSHQKKP